MTATAMKRFMGLVQVQGGHWIWIGMKKKSSGMPVFWDGVKRTSARRWIYETRFGRTAARSLRATCGRSDCVRPEHAARGTVQPTLPVVRFMNHVRLVGDHWIWTASVDYRRHIPMFALAAGEKVPALRWIYQHTRGITLGRRQRVLPTCGMRRCVNPGHCAPSVET